MRPKHAANVGAAARAIANFGLGPLWLVAPRCRLDKEAYALATHAEAVLDAVVEVATLDEALADRELAVATSARRRRHHGHVSADPEAVLPGLVGRRAAIVFGPEESGLDNEALDRCQAIVTVPTAAAASINLAQTVVVIGYAWHRATAAPIDPAGLGALAAPVPGDRGAPAVGPTNEAPERAQVEAMFEQWRVLLRRVGYTDAARETAVMRKYRSLIGRAAPSADEVTLLRGLWYQLAWAVEQVPERLPPPAGRDAEGSEATAPAPQSSALDASPPDASDGDAHHG